MECDLGREVMNQDSITLEFCLNILSLPASPNSAVLRHACTVCADYLNVFVRSLATPREVDICCARKKHNHAETHS